MSPARLAPAFILTFALGAVAGGGGAQSRPRMWADTLVDTTTADLRWPKTHVRVNVDHWDPGAQSDPHQHPGPTVIYVLDGQLQEVSGSGATRILRQGEAVWNPARTRHNVRNLTDRPARALAVHLDPGR